VPGGDPSHSSSKFLAASLLALLIAQLTLNWLLLRRLNIHWDEFHYLGQLFEYERGEPLSRFQTFHVHLLSWIAGLGGTELSKILAGRYVMFGIQGATLFLIASMLFRFGRVPALYALLAFTSLPEFMIHGASFRSDPILQFLYALTLASPLSFAGAAVAGAATALSLLLNLKASLFLVLFLCFRLMTGGFDRRWWIVYIVVLCVLAASLFWFHSSSIVSAAPSGSGKTLQTVFFGFLLSGVSAAGVSTLMASARSDPLFWITALSGVYILLRDRRTRALAIWTVLPFAVMLFYRNAWPYFLPAGMLPLVYPLAASASWWQRSRYGHYAILLSALLFSGQGGFTFYQHRNSETRAQAAVMTTIHNVFPEPAPYIDRCFMIASFPSAGPFLTTWSVEEYRKKGQPLYTSSPARFLIANSPVFFGSDPGLLDADREYLRRNFIPWWGPIHLRGVRVDLNESDFEIQIPGVYQLQSAAPVLIDAALVQPGEHLLLRSGRHNRASIPDAKQSELSLLLLPISGRSPEGDFPSDPLFRY